MPIRSYRGCMIYQTHGVGETGREYFSVTVTERGSRTLRAQCEMDDDRLLRDVVLSVDSDWRPTDAFIRLMLDQQLLGCSWFRFTAAQAECEGWTADQGRIRQVFPLRQPTACFGTHSLHGDAWTIARLRAHVGPLEQFEFVNFACSTLPNGGSGPSLIAVPSGFARVLDLGEEEITTAAGEFATRRIRVEIPGVDCFDVWGAGEDCLPVRLTSQLLNQSYEMTEIVGEWR